MDGFLYLILGTILLALVIYDFFYTTLSGSGAGFFSHFLAAFSHKLVQLIVKISGRGIYGCKGLVVILTVLFSWIAMAWLGLFLVFSSDPEAITNSDGRVANVWERLYFTGYTLSTLGIGNFKPNTAFFETLTSCFSFFGFIFFTSSMTYFISVSSAVINKRTLARSIQNLGKEPQQIVEKFLSLDTSYSYSYLLALQEMIDRHCVNHLAYPIVHFYSHPDPDVCLSINLTRLDEAVSILLNSEKGGKLLEELKPLRFSLNNFLNHINKNFSRSLPKEKSSPTSMQFPYEISGGDYQNFLHRRKILGGLLKSEGFSWKDVRA